MRKKIHHRLLPVLAAILLLTGCGSDSGNYSKYVTLGDYQNLKVTRTVEAVTAENESEAEKEKLNEYVEYKEVDGPVKEGQMVNISMLAKEGEEVVYDFSDEDGYDMTVGGDEFGKQVDEALIGTVSGDKLDLEVTYTEDFADAMLCGKTISFHIVVKTISDLIYPELTNEFVKENFGYETIEQWRQSIKDELQESNEQDADQNVRDELVQAAVDACRISGYPKSLYKEKEQETIDGYQSYADMFGCSLENVYEIMDADEEERRQETLDAVNETMVLAEIRRQEQLTLTDGQIQECLEAYAKENEYDSVEELLSQYDEAELKTYFLNEKTIDFLQEHATIAEN